MRNNDGLADPGLGTYTRREAAPASELHRESHRGMERRGMPGKATRTGSMAMAGVAGAPGIQLQRSMTTAACDIASLEAATRSGDLMRALWTRGVVQRFIMQVPQLLAMVPSGAAIELTAQVRGLLDRATAAVERAAKTSASRPEAPASGASERTHVPVLQLGAHGSGERTDEAAPSPVIGQPAHSGAAKAIDETDGSLGSQLPSALRSELEPALGANLSAVRIHTGAASARAADALAARAYATGQDIHFGTSAYDPSSPAGRHLIAHEVAHTVQQQGAAPGIQCMARVSAPGDTAERQAERFAHAFVAGGNTHGIVTAGMQPAAAIHRFGRDEHADLATKHLIGLYDYLRTPPGKQWAKDHGYPNPEDLIKRIEADPVVKTNNESLKPGETKNHVAKLHGKSTDFDFGELTALMGDLFGHWESLYNADENQRQHLMGEDSTASNEKYTKGEYLRLAANNQSHFAGKNQDAWRAMHKEAIKVAMNSKADDAAFNQALFIEAASCHFLTDAFSAGHQFEKDRLMAAVQLDLRRNPLRAENPAMQVYLAVADVADGANITNLIVKAIHDRMNEEGFEVTNGKGMTWKTAGDGNLAKSPETQRIAALAVFESRQQIFSARGATKAPDVELIEAFFPDVPTRNRANWQAIGYIPEARKQVEQILYHERKEGASKLGDIGGYLVEHNLEAIGDPSRERDILRQQDFDRRNGGTGTAVGSQFEWRFGK